MVGDFLSFGGYLELVVLLILEICLFIFRIGDPRQSWATLIDVDVVVPHRANVG